MQNFKQYLAEATGKNIAPWQDPSNPAFINADPSKFFDGSVTRNKNGTYSTSAANGNHIKLAKLEDNQIVLPIKFSIMSYFETISGKDNGLTTLQGCPDRVRKEMWIDSKNLTTLDYLYTKVDWKLTIDCPNLKTFGDAKSKCLDLILYDIGDVPLAEVPHHFEVTSTIFLTASSAYRKTVLSVLKVKGPWNNVASRLGVSNWRNDPDNAKSKEVEKVCLILSKHAKSRNILECQEELIDAGYKDYAEL